MAFGSIPSTGTNIGERYRPLEFCPDPGVDPNGLRSIPPPRYSERRFEAFPQGSQLQFSCREGFSLHGQDSLFCLIGGVWSSPPPTCKDTTRAGSRSDDLMYCSNPGPVLNGNIDILRLPPDPRHQPTVDSTGDAEENEYSQGTRLQYTCEKGYKMHGAANITCQNTGFWSAKSPTCVGDCGRSLAKASRRVSHGQRTKAGEWPWTVGVAAVQNNHPSLICGGALLNRRTILTAAHCFDLPGTFQLFFGKYMRRMEDDDAKVIQRTKLKVMIHPDYNSSTYHADIALVRLSPSVKLSSRIQPICLPSAETTSKNIYRGQKGYVTGWGVTENHLPSDSLLLAHIPVLPAEPCIEAFQNRSLKMPITANMFCAGFEDGKTNVCTGDSGSPFVFYDHNQERYVLEGVVSFGVSGQCGLPGRYTVFTQVLPYMPWILRNMS